MTTTTPPARTTAPAKPITPRPLWERHHIFQEPVLPEGLHLLEDEDEED